MEYYLTIKKMKDLKEARHKIIYMVLFHLYKMSGKS